MQGQSPCPRSAERGSPLCLLKRRRGFKGEPSPGVPPLFFTLLRVRRYFGRWSLPPAAIRPHFFGACPKKRCRAAKEKRFFYPGGSTIRVSAAASVDGGHLRPTWGGAWWLTGRSSQLDAVGGDVGASSSWERRAGPNMSRGGTQKRVSLELHPVSLRKSKEMGWNGQGQRGLLPNKTAHTCKAKDKAASSSALSTCAPIRWEVVVSLACHSTPFLWCLPKETVSSRQRKALFLPWRLHHSRERCCFVGGTFLARLWGGAGAGLW